MKKTIVAGNWKMNLNFEEAENLLFELNEQLMDTPPNAGVEVIVCPPFPFLELAADIADDEIIKAGAQNCSDHDNGALTGEVSASMLKSIDVSYVIIGHSERRKYFTENSSALLNKVCQCLKNELIPIFCCGENLSERENNTHFQVVKTQLDEVVFKLNESDFENIIIAYEPVWAIGTGKTATTSQAQEMHSFIRNLIEKKYGKTTANNTHIIYGGSCNSKNAAELFACNDVDGGLIGGASINKDEFLTIIYSA